jgi:hypothetical protein
MGTLFRVAANDAGADALDDRVAVAKTAFVARLDDVASWCDTQRVFAVRDGVFRRILLLAPDHARARAALKYRRESKAGPSGPWVQASDYKEPIDWNKGLVPEAKQRLADAGAAYRQSVMDALSQAEKEGAIKPARRDEAIERLVDVMPDDAELRRTHGDVESKGRWVLPETVDAVARRLELRAAVERSAEAAAPITPDVKSVASGWTFAFAVGGRSVRGTVGSAEGATAAKTVRAVEAFCAEVLALKDPPKRPRAIVLVADRGQAKKFLRERSADAETLATVDHVSSLWTKDSDLVIFNTDAEERRESVVRQLIDVYLDVRTVGVTRGWVSEGVGQRLMWHFLGRHGMPFLAFEGTDRPTDERDAAPLPARGSPWLRAAYEATDRGGPAGFRLLFTRALNAFHSADALMAYGLGAYLLEARPDSFVSFLQAAGTLEGPDEVCQSALNVDADVLYWRVRRWLSEQ